jgi:hypothetical protein
MAVSLPVTAMAATTYVLSRDAADARTLNVTVDRPPSAASATVLNLRGAQFGMTIGPQVAGVSCDGHLLLKNPDAGSWVVPEGCRHLSWQIPLDVAVGGDASMQRSVGSTAGSFLFVSETSSLPRLAESVPPELLAVPRTLGGETIPRPRPDATILLPKPSEAPLFLLLGSRPVAERSLGRVHLAYFLDDPAQLDPTVRGVSANEPGAPGLAHINVANTRVYVDLNAGS